MAWFQQAKFIFAVADFALHLLGVTVERREIKVRRVVGDILVCIIRAEDIANNDYSPDSLGRPPGSRAMRRSKMLPGAGCAPRRCVFEGTVLARGAPA